MITKSQNPRHQLCCSSTLIMLAASQCRCMVNTIRCIYSNCFLMMYSYSIQNMWRIDCSNKLRKKGASCWSLISKYIMLHGPEDVKSDRLHNIGSTMAATQRAIRDRGISLMVRGGSMMWRKWRYRRRQLCAGTGRQDGHKGNCDMKMIGIIRPQKGKIAENRNWRQLWYENDQ